MFDKKRLRIREQNNIYYWKCTKRCGATFRTIFEHGEHKQDNCFINNDHSHAPDTVINTVKNLRLLTTNLFYDFLIPIFKFNFLRRKSNQRIINILVTFVFHLSIISNIRLFEHIIFRTDNCSYT